MNSSNAVDDGTFTELQQTVDSASNGDVIVLEKNYTYNEATDSSLSSIILNKSLVIEGNNHTINAMHKSGIFRNEKNSLNFTFNNITFMNAGDTYSLSAVYTVSPTNINYCTFYNCSNNESSGPAIAVYSTLYLRNSLIINNTDYYDMLRPVIHAATGYIINSSFYDNYGTGGVLGGFSLTVINSTFINNNGGSFGGGINANYIRKVENSIFINNTAERGGAIWGDIEDIYNSTFINNNATEGGAIYYFIMGEIYETIKINNNIFIDNKATGHGGVIYTNAMVKANYNVFLNNSANYGTDFCLNTTYGHDLEYNWWGNNTPFTVNNRLYIGKNSTEKPETWVILTTELLDDYVEVNTETGLIVKLSTYYNESSNDNGILLDNIPIRELYYSDYITLSTIINRNDTVIFTPSSTGVFSIKVKVDNEELEVPIVVIGKDVDLGVVLNVNLTTGVVNVTDYLEFTITLSNKGPSPAIRVNTSFIIPTKLEYVNDTSEGAYDVNSGVWYLKSLDANDEKSIKVLTKVKDYGLIVSEVTTSSPNNDVDSSNDKSRITINAEQIVDLKISVMMQEMNNVLNYTINVSNEGHTGVTGVFVNCPVPVGLNYLSDDSNGAFDKVSGVWTIGNMDEYDTKLLSICALVTGDSLITGIFSLHLNENDANLNDNNITMDVNPTVNLKLTASVNETEIYMEDYIEYRITITNNGPCDALNTIVNITYSEELEYKSYNSTGTYNNQNKQWTIGTLPLGEKTTLIINYQAKINGTLKINSTVTSTVPEINTTDNNKYIEITSKPTIDLKLTISANQTKLGVGEQVNISYTITNIGILNANDIYVTCTLPSGLSYADSSDQGQYSTRRIGRKYVGYYSLFNSLEPGKNITFNIIADVDSPQDEIIEYSAIVYGTEHDINASNDISSINFTIVPIVDLEITITQIYTQPTNIIRYQIYIINNGENEAKNVTANIPIPNTLKYTTSTPDKGTYNLNTGIWTIGDLDILSTGNNQASMLLTCNITQIGTITFTGDVDSNYKDRYIENNNASTSLSILNPLNIESYISVNSINTLENTNFQISGNTNTYQGTVTINILNSQNNTINTKTTTITDGKFTSSFTGLNTGTYQIQVEFTDTNNIFKNTTNTTTLTINPQPIMPPTPPINSINNTNTTNTTEDIDTNLITIINIANNTITINGILMGNNTPITNQNITIQINNNTYQTTTNSTGNLNFILNLTMGEYNITITYKGYNNNLTHYKPTNNTQTISINTTNNPTNTTETNDIQVIIKADNVEGIYGQSNKLIGYITDINENPIVGHHLFINLSRVSNGAWKIYEVISDYKGEFTLPINLASGLYSATITYMPVKIRNISYSSTNPVTSTITINSDSNKTLTILKSTNLVKTYGTDDDFIGYLYDSKNSPVIGQHVSLTLTRLSSGASKTYDTVTDYKGEFHLAINLAPGEYTVTCSYVGIMGYQSINSFNTITVLR